MKILLSTLPEMQIGGGRTVVPPLGLEYIASNIRGNHEVMVFEQLLQSEKPLHSEGKTSVWGLSVNQFLSIVAGFNPDVIGFSCVFSYQHDILVEYLIGIKQQFPHIKTIAGGNHVTAYHKDHPKMPNLDAYIMGEGEIAFNLFLEGKLEEGKTYPIENIDSLNPPYRDLLPHYFQINKPHDGATNAGGRVASMITSRGCPYNCLFCSVKTIWGRKFRGRSPENVIGEIIALKTRFGITENHFEDDNLLFDRERMMRICEQLIPLKIRWTCPNGVDLSKLDRELLKAMVDSGCYRVTICPESMNDRILRFYHKPFNVELIKEKIALLKEFPVERVGFFIVGAPDETTQEAFNTIKTAVNDFDSYDMSFLAAYPGTDLFEYCKENDLLTIKEDDFINMRADYSGTIKRKISPDQLIDLFYIGRKLKDMGVKI